MKTNRMKWLGLVLVVLATNAVQAGSTVIYKHYCYGSAGSWTYVRNGSRYNYATFDVPANTASFKIEAGLDGHGGYGDVDLYVGYGYDPVARNQYHYRSVYPYYKERIVKSNPPAGRYYIRLKGLRVRYGGRTYTKYRTCLKIVITPKTSTTGWKTDLLNKMNYERGRRGVAALRYNSILERAATLYAQDMAYYNYTGHTGRDGSRPVDRVSRQGYSWYRSENLRYGYDVSGSSYVPLTVNQIMYGGIYGWMTEPEPAGHRENILDRYATEVGFGRGYNPNAKYKYYWCADYGRR